MPGELAAGGIDSGK